MKSRYVACLVAGVMTVSVLNVACGADTGSDLVTEESSVSVEESTSTIAATAEEVGLANPWRDITEEEAHGVVARLFKAPEGATNVQWSILDSVADPSGFPGPLVQLTFTLDEVAFTAREQATGDSEADLSGLYYEWTATDEGVLANWAGGEMPAKFYRYIGENEYIDLCTFYDVEYGAAYSISADSADLDGFDLQAVVEQMYDPVTNSIGDEEVEENAHVPMDITGCDTFTNIVDKLNKDQGYANVTIGDVDVLLVTEYTFEDTEAGKSEAIDADVYYYTKDGKLEYAGYVTSGGTAYPLSVKDGKLYVGGNHYFKKYSFVGESIFVIDEEAWVEYDEDGNGTYFAHSDIASIDGADENGQVADDSIMNEIYDEMTKGEVVDFQVVK